MKYQIEKIHLSVEKQEEEGEIDYSHQSTDVIVELNNGDVYAASFFTYAYLDELIQKNKADGAFLHGKYFWVEAMVFVEDCALVTVREIVHLLMEEGDFEMAFQKL